jgi:hypothetical protein
MEAPLATWWALLCAAAALNVALWVGSAWWLAGQSASLPARLYASRKVQLWLSAGYVLGCGFRSLLPMVDVPRICLHDNMVSRIAVGRTVATVAELCFAIQWALLLQEAGGGKGVASRAGSLIVPIIVAAEVFSWAAVTSHNYLLHAVENSLWTLAAILGLAGFMALRPQATGARARFLEAAMACAAGYIAFMAIVDVPMYLARWRMESGIGDVPLAEGVRTLLARCVVEPRWEAWRVDVPWMTLYFTVAVWISVAITHAPRLRARGYE